MKYLTLLIALSAASIGAAQTWTLELDFEPTPVLMGENYTLSGSGTMQLTNWKDVSDSTDNTPPWTGEFVNFGYVPYFTSYAWSIPDPYQVPITLNYSIAIDTNSGYQSWSLNGGAAKLRKYSFKTYVVLGVGGGD